jgi:hypothetical protein
MPEIIPQILAPYLRRGAQQHSLSLVTSTLTTTSHWLILRHIHAAIFGPQGASTGAPVTRGTPDYKVTVILVSILQPLDLWVELGKKIVCDHEPEA